MHYVLDDEEDARLDELLDALHAAIGPACAVEDMLVDRLAFALLREGRAARLEAQAVGTGPQPADPARLDLALRYQRLLDRQIGQALRELRLLRREPLVPLVRRQAPGRRPAPPPEPPPADGAPPPSGPPPRPLLTLVPAHEAPAHEAPIHEAPVHDVMRAPSRDRQAQPGAADPAPAGPEDPSFTDAPPAAAVPPAAARPAASAAVAVTGPAGDPGGRIFPSPPPGPRACDDDGSRDDAVLPTAGATVPPCPGSARSSHLPAAGPAPRMSALARELEARFGRPASGPSPMPGDPAATRPCPPELDTCPPHEALAPLPGEPLAAHARHDSGPGLRDVQAPPAPGPTPTLRHRPPAGPPCRVGRWRGPASHGETNPGGPASRGETNPSAPASYGEANPSGTATAPG